MSVTVRMEREPVSYGRYRLVKKRLNKFFIRTNCFFQPPTTFSPRQLRLIEKLSSRIKMEVTVEAEQVLRLYRSILESRANDSWSLDNRLFYFRDNEALIAEYLKPAVLMFSKAVCDHVDSWGAPQRAYLTFVREYAEQIDRILRRFVAKYHLYVADSIAKPLRLHFRKVTCVTILEEEEELLRITQLARWWRRPTVDSDDELEMTSPFLTDGSNLPLDV